MLRKAAHLLEDDAVAALPRVREVGALLADSAVEQRHPSSKLALKSARSTVARLRRDHRQMSVRVAHHAPTEVGRRPWRG